MVARRWSARRERPRGQSRADDGYSVLEASITVPIMFFLLMAIVQWAIVWHARGVAQAAAQKALRTAERYASTAGAGVQDGDKYLAQLAPHVLGQQCVSVTRTATIVSVRVHCKVLSVLPFGEFDVDESISGPVETWSTNP
jgi:Flp pilus assembly protein TadG